MKSRRSKRIARKRNRFTIAVSLILAVLLVPFSAFADNWNIGNGDIEVTVSGGIQTVTQGTITVEDDAPVISGSSTTSVIVINVGANEEANVTLSGVDIDVSAEGKAALSTSGAGDVNVELDGANTLTSGEGEAGLEKNSDGKLTITDENDDGSLKATGGLEAAGIGGGAAAKASNITISNAEVDALGEAAGIGGGYGGNADNITISNSTVTAQGINGGAGIGSGGEGGNGGSNIVITDSTVMAVGGHSGAGIGGGFCDDGENITIINSHVTATATINGAGIGGGGYGDGDNITIVDSFVVANGGDKAAGIGGGVCYDEETGGHASNIVISGKSDVYATQGAARNNTGHGAAIGTAGNRDSSDNPIDGVDTGYDVSGLTAGGIVRFFEPSAEDPYLVIEGPTPAPAPVGEEPLFQVLDKEEADAEYEQAVDGSVLTIKAPTDYAVLTGKLSALKTLLDKGITEIVFVTNGTTSTFSVAELISKGAGEETFTLTHDGDKVVFLLGETDVSSLLK